MDNSGALVSYRSEPLNLDFRNYLNNLTAEPCVDDSYTANMYATRPEFSPLYVVS